MSFRSNPTSPPPTPSSGGVGGPAMGLSSSSSSSLKYDSSSSTARNLRYAMARGGGYESSMNHSVLVLGVKEKRKPHMITNLIFQRSFVQNWSINHRHASFIVASIHRQFIAATSSRSSSLVTTGIIIIRLSKLFESIKAKISHVLCLMRAVPALFCGHRMASFGIR